MKAHSGWAVYICFALLVLSGCGGSGTSRVEWIQIPGGTFMMGSDSGEIDELPVHQVTVPAFNMSKTEVTVAQYRKCFKASACTEPEGFTGETDLNWLLSGRDDHPVNYVDWDQASAFCQWAGGRLPSEAEWEYAARSGGKDITYPWGDQVPSCQYAVMGETADQNGCGEIGTWAVCRKTAGNTEQGLCDMAGNVREFVQDYYHGSYDCDANPFAEYCNSGGVAPTDGSAWESVSGEGYRVFRGGSLAFHPVMDQLRVSSRIRSSPGDKAKAEGFRCARDVN